VTPLSPCRPLWRRVQGGRNALRIVQRFEQYKDAFGHVLPLQAVSDHVDHAADVATVVDAPSDCRRHRAEGERDGKETLAEIGRSYSVSAGTIARLI